MNLIINRVKYKLSDIFSDQICFSKIKGDNLFCMTKQKLTKITKSQDFTDWSETIDDNAKIYFDFKRQANENDFATQIQEYFIPKYVRRTLINIFKSNKILVDSHPQVADLSVYLKKEQYNDSWDRYYRFDMKILNDKKEISISIGSENTIISKNALPYDELYENAKFFDEDREIYRHRDGDKSAKYIIANFKIKKTLGIVEPGKLKYKDHYDTVSWFYNDYLRNSSNLNLHFISVGLRNTELREVSKIRILDNKLIFKDEKTDVNPITGMRDYGFYKSSPKAYTTQFIFIYRNRNDANQLYSYLKNGYKNFPGLERYVGIPITIAAAKGFCYTQDNIEDKFNDFEKSNLDNESGQNLFAIVIGDFDKNDTTEEKTNIYYNLKNKLLKRKIPSQFICEKHIRQANTFNYHLPNIAIGILAKSGGIPWRLQNHIQKELIIGFNQIKNNNNKFIGSSVFFTNEGVIQNVYAYPEASSESEMINVLRTSILEYIKQNKDIHRLVIHYYKTQSEKESKKIEQLLYEELRINIPYAIVEINDSKSQMDICFDADYYMGMPMSGSYVNLGNNEYLLFNNTRHIERPLTKVSEELPIKVKIHFADNGGFSHNELISQIYEFSRLIWKGLKQRSQPATTIYAKLIAEFSAHFGGHIPQNDITIHSPWFI